MHHASHYTFSIISTKIYFITRHYRQFFFIKKKKAMGTWVKWDTPLISVLGKQDGGSL